MAPSSHMAAIIIQKRDIFFFMYLLSSECSPCQDPPASLTGDKKRWAESFNLSISKTDMHLGLDK